MKRYLCFYYKYLSYIAYIFGISIVFSSCITINKSKPSTIEEMSKYDNRRIIIETIDDNRYKLKWFEEKGDSIVSKKNTKRIRIGINEPEQIMIGDRIVSLDLAVNYSGIVQIKTEIKNYKFINIYVKDDQIIGLKRTGKEVLPVVIHKDQIKKIRVNNQGASTAVSIVAGVVIISGITLLLIYSFGFG